MRLLVLFIFFINFDAWCAGDFISPEDIYQLPSRPADFRFQYGPDPANVGELRIPNSHGSLPVVVLIHGGCWLTKFADMHMLDPVATALTNAGFATWNIEYRRIDEPGGGWTGTFDDVGKGIDYLEHMARQYNFDLTRVVAMGHSSGGSLALWAAGRHRLPPDSDLYSQNPVTLKGAISLGGVPDLAGFIPMAVPVCETDVIKKLLGGSPQMVPDHYSHASPIEMLPLGVPQVLITGLYDEEVPLDQVRPYVAKALTLGEDVVLITVPEAGHFEVVDPTFEGWSIIEGAVIRLFEK